MDILGLLHPQDIFVRATAEARRPLLRAIAATLANQSGLSDDTVLTALLNRESLGSTGIEKGIAVPHALLRGLSKPFATLVILERPIWFRAPDDQPVDVVLGIISPLELSTEFTRALARVCRVLSDPDILEGMRLASSPNEIIARIETASDHSTNQLAGGLPPTAPAARTAKMEGRP
ncbi:PTS sugar transporter subunit IIA [Aliihoeflea sp. 2WW]|uniref:PTS sugar transporter subunit IIA n=1 Tax=Aliihoeflea sp. 2WW TaxID=1381123 RepID=UPI0004635CFF|nr:PTS sugar transporter subunit IIA [Aliihoeflea sp. 2WW]